MSTALHVEDQTDQTTAPGISDPDPASLPRSADAYADVQCLCPHCGTFNAGVGKTCAHCDLPDNSETRSISGMRPGQWFVLDPHNPDAPEMEFQELQSLADCQMINSRSVVRGPGTGQLWRLASSIRGLSREFGVCYSCGGSIESDEIICPHCDRSQKPLASSSKPQPVPPVAPPVEVIEVADAPPASLLEEMTPGIPDPVEITPAPPAVENKPSAVRVSVHTRAEHRDTSEQDLLIRPVIAEQSERHIPKDDLLTPRDLAKAFHLEFGNQSDEYLKNIPKNRQKKIVISAAVAFLAAVGVAWPAVHIVNGWITANAIQPPAGSSTTPPPARGPQYADARTAGMQMPGAGTIFAPATGEFTLPRDKTSNDPIIVPDPAPSLSSDDDPATLWNQGLDAESTGNYAKAVAAYERIQSLPSNLWPPHLEVRLDMARKELKGELR
jgi:hypothetical protein